ncbi:MAG: serine/threonine protein kinase [Candidatus Marinimicrobia bacterium]|nr:serine/threonine protein kinase [Candidatus Neomarinimicrobiota bacterium]
MKIKGFKVEEILAERQELSLVKAKQLSLNRPVFLKILKELESDPIILDRFEREAKLLARLNHPNIVTIYEFSLTAKRPYLALEYFEGQDLAVYLEHNHPLSANMILSIAKQVLSGCSKAHLSGVLHSDIKPENLLINQDGLVKITDFGLANLFGSGDVQLVGTAGFMAPELALGEANTTLTDIYAIGMTLYTLIVGENPLKGANLSESLNLAIQENPPDIKLRRSDIPQPLVNLINRMICKAPHDRVQSCDRALEILIEIEVDQEQHMTPLHISPQPFIDKTVRQRSPIHKAWFAFPVLAIFLLIIFYLSPWDKPKLMPNQDEGRAQIIDMSEDVSKTDSAHPIISKTIVETDTDKKAEAASQSVLERGRGILNPDESPAVTQPPQLGSLYLLASPWANIWIDSLEIGTTPLYEPVSMTPGSHSVQFMHPKYPNIKKQVDIRPNQADTLTLNWNDELGFLRLTVHPWAEVYVNSKAIDITPLRDAIPLQPGEFQLLLKNPDYPPWNQFLKVAAGDTLYLNVRLQKSDGT